MLLELAVEGLGAIDRAEISLGTGCSALTGETGAGKTLLVVALGLLTGARADRTLVREGAAEARAEGRFVVPSNHPAAAFLKEQDLAEAIDGEVEIVVTRSVASDGGGTKARINGRMTTAAVLTDLGQMLVEIAGQHDQQRFGSSTAQRSLLDEFAGTDVVASAERVRMAVRQLTEGRRRLEQLVASEKEREREIDSLRHEIEEIAKADLTEGEGDNLRAEAARLEHASAITGSLSSVKGALRKEGGAIELVQEATRSAEEASQLDPGLKGLAQRLEGLAIELEDVAQEAGARDVSPDPDALARARDRLGVIAGLRRRYGDTEREILDYLESAKSRVEELEVTGDDIERLRKEIDAQSAAVEEEAGRLSDARAAAAARLEPEMEGLLHELALPQARFEVVLEPTALHEGGNERVEFRLAANPGEKPRPISKVASGGELSRVALALHVLTGTGSADTLVFDEVDAGVGGEAAQSVGRALSRLARERSAQVVVVTHLPQVAAFADDQYRVLKRTGSERASVVVEHVEGAERVEELSRMLAGLPESERARSHAEELLEIAASRARP